MENDSSLTDDGHISTTSNPKLLKPQEARYPGKPQSL